MTVFAISSSGRGIVCIRFGAFRFSGISSKLIQLLSRAAAVADVADDDNDDDDDDDAAAAAAAVAAAAVVVVDVAVDALGGSGGGLGDFP